MSRVTKFKSMNLFGETRQQEKSRLLKERVKSALSGRSRNVSFGAGTSSSQKRKRRAILRKSGLRTKTPRYLDLYE